MIFVKPDEKSNRKNRINKPVSLTGTMQTIISSMSEQCSENQLIRKLTKRNYITVEYETEILIIQGKLKACFDKDGKMIWATKTKYKGEGRNILTSKNYSPFERLKLLRISSIGLKETKERANKYWIWRDVKVSDQQEAKL